MFVGCGRVSSPDSFFVFLVWPNLPCCRVLFGSFVDRVLGSETLDAAQLRTLCQSNNNVDSSPCLRPAFEVFSLSYPARRRSRHASSLFSASCCPRSCQDAINVRGIVFRCCELAAIAYASASRWLCTIRILRLTTAVRVQKQHMIVKKRDSLIVERRFASVSEGLDSNTSIEMPLGLIDQTRANHRPSLRACR